uniref:4'-phosphopantetheinyl transferase domain-containing protein n=1 Tax=Haptolina ericina TaxID=156174 RepID=A0A7S3BM89_9EUKA|mmetsp:Transcript_62981/g.140239  ORF Transcript_62981/g.140239 Transcript_62981/m.140239 type:complete len:311 (+) Transcript_62981:57-989(+)|eukprot:CAMPEP_0181238572 /NCGR_PEP_ID=MMETSP1096-20121128/39430_1 /TAXON_ID=156174 ORGANISM="Chrysochromulina ericina, Strain CCMP281" /NCGR_SAMPLE_ID=MMETSP1096 /ASSEMBLY_ACC=CAM_ASM_000453 /LENGTH=310 /DNA_ID=CAMNT_0023334127 /DNA_START=37 /DNA_END=969 /DNA_ORIENTATION=+
MVLLRMVLFSGAVGRISAFASGTARTLTRQQQASAEGAFATVFQGSGLHGGFVAVRLPTLTHPSREGGVEDSDLEALLPYAELHPDEVEHMRDMQPQRRTLFAGGRVAMRRALLQHSLDGVTTRALESEPEWPVLPGLHGAPALPSGWLGSISHTRGLAAALVDVSGSPLLAGDQTVAGIGIDVEHASRRVSPLLPRRTLSLDERASLGDNGLDKDADTLLRFSIKEALYKAIHPMLPGTIPWHSVTVWPNADGSCTVDVTGLEATTGMELRADASWLLKKGFFVTTASAECPTPESRRRHVCPSEARKR